MKRSICGLIVQDLSRPNLVELVMYDHCDHLIVQQIFFRFICLVFIVYNMDEDDERPEWDWIKKKMI